MRVPLLAMAGSMVGILIAAVTTYSELGNTVNVSETSLLLAVLSTMVFLVAWLAALREAVRRDRIRKTPKGDE